MAPGLKASTKRRNVLQFLLSKEYLVLGAYTELEKESGELLLGYEFYQGLHLTILLIG